MEFGKCYSLKNQICYQKMTLFKVDHATKKLFCFRVQNLLIDDFFVLDSISASWVNFQDHCGTEEKRSKWLLALDKNFRCEKVVERGKSSFRYELNSNNNNIIKPSKKKTNIVSLLI